MKKKLLLCASFLIFQLSFSQSINEDFEETNSVNNWQADQSQLDSKFNNPSKNDINTSNTVLKYIDNGGQYANVFFINNQRFDLSTNFEFSIKIYVASSDITGNQNNQVSLKLQNGDLGENSWTTQTEIIKPITLDTWQTITFDFDKDNFIMLGNQSVLPKDRTDYNKVLIQINGENNNDHVIAYIDDFFYNGTFEVDGDTNFDTLVWSDEFEGSALDKTKWFQQIQPIVNGVDWANNEEQHYTNRIDNSYVESGSLFLKAKRESYTFNSATKNYTSARLNSKYAFKYGKVEVRAKLPSVAGTWPAIWLLGKNIDEDGTYFDEEFGDTPWPFCGEIDIMEPNIAKTEILGTWHWHDGDGHTYNTKHIPTNNVDTSTNFHIYSLIWTENSMKIYMDDILINEMDTFGAFTKDFFILLNVAMGGSLGGAVDPIFTEDVMEIDYVRVYQESSSLSVDNENLVNSVNLYPNPVENELTIKVPSSLVGAKGTIYSVLGQKVANFVQNKENITKNFSRLKKGIYIITLEKDSFLEKYKFIKN